MSGHSKWSSIKHKKAAADAKRGKLFSKLAREIITAAKTGGGDPDTNPRLRTVLATAKSANMPNDNINKAIMKGTGELPGVTYEEATFEAYGPGGVAILFTVLTDNKKRTVSEIRHILGKNNGNLGETGCVAWMFDKKGLITVEKSLASEDDVFTVALDAGAEDVVDEGDTWHVYTEPQEFMSVKAAFDASPIEVSSASLTMNPKTLVRVAGNEATQVLRLLDSLEDQDDVQEVHANFDIPDEELAEMAAG